uniref:Uncharacterized protein LOC105142358 isoform X3 n=1 Tax=Rhizophora mucronata TaxID=61149 RepID=A0A2P2L6H1_RHIMU
MLTNSIFLFTSSEFLLRNFNFTLLDATFFLNVFNMTFLGCICHLLLTWSLMVHLELVNCLASLCFLILTIWRLKIVLSLSQ